jgi:hypothetical protein
MIIIQIVKKVLVGCLQEIELPTPKVKLPPMICAIVHLLKSNAINKKINIILQYL